MPLRSRVRDLRRETRRNNASETNRSSNTETGTTLETDAGRDTIQPIGEDQNEQSSSHVSFSDTRSSLPASNGRGGPERTSRNRTTNGRSHPYVRPPSVD